LFRNVWQQRILVPAGMAVLAMVLPFSTSRAAGPEGGLADWKFEVLHLKNGRALQGLVLEETKTSVKFYQIKRPKGEKAQRHHHIFQASEVASIDRLSDKDREILWERVQALAPEFTNRAVLLEKIDAQLQPATWGDGKKEAWSYASAHFVLVSNASRETVGWAALSLEQIYAAYANFLPPRRPLHEITPTPIWLAASIADYLELAKSKGIKIYNPAYYDSKHNQIVCGSEFQRLDKALEDLRKQDGQLAKQLADLKKRYKGKIPAILTAQIRRDKEAIDKARSNIKTRVYEPATKRLFQTLYHEAFHAYLDNFVYPAQTATVPCWLNEGLAQVFETAQIDANELRVGQVDKERLLRVQALLRAQGLVALEKLLPATPKEFLVRHASDHQLSDSYYLSSWALAFYLLVDRKVLGNPKKLDLYINSLKRGDNPLVAFGTLVGKPLPEFQKDFRDYLLRLRPDGSLGK
jgi:hypothetical protein